MRVLSIILATITLFFGFTPSAWAGSELVTPLLVIGPNSSAFQCIVTNATATSKVNVDLTLIDLFGKHSARGRLGANRSESHLHAGFPGPRPLSCVVDVRNGKMPVWCAQCWLPPTAKTTLPAWWRPVRH